MSKIEKVVVQGLGFVGSAMATAIASKEDSKGTPLFNVIGVDKSNALGKDKIKAINSGVFPFLTNDRKIIKELQKAVKRGNLKATDDTSVYSKANVILVSINCDLETKGGKQKVATDFFLDGIKQIANLISEKTLVIIESTVPPGTCKKLIYPIFIKAFRKRELNINNFFLAHSYERVMPGEQYFNSIINYWRVFAGINSQSSKKCETFLSKIINVRKYPLSRLNDTTSSEVGKLLENSYRAVNIAFIEEWARFSEDIGIDLFHIIDAVRLRPTHSNIRQPGFGVGGYCLTKDPLFSKIAAKDIFNLPDHHFPFSTQAVKINNEMPLVTLNKLKGYFQQKMKGRKILLMGASYRQDIGDTRFSPSEKFVKEAISLGAKITVQDPLVSYWDELNMEIENEIPNTLGLDAIVFAVPHKEYKKIDINRWIKTRSTFLFDANNVLTTAQHQQIKSNNLNYLSIGRG